MSVFDLFQRATCEIGEGDYGAADESLSAAIVRAETTGEDDDMLPDLRELLNTVRAKA